MFRFSPRTLFSQTRTLFSQTRTLSTSSPSHLTYPHSDSHPDLGVTVWWDLEKCNVPSGVNIFRGAQAITDAIESSGIKGPIHITAYGDILRLATTDQGALSSKAGVKLRHIPHDVNGDGDCPADRCLFIDLMFWALDNPPPAHLFLITASGVYSSILYRLRMSNYDILLATTKSASSSLCAAATIGWDWDALVRGENLTGTYFNQPHPWYGHYEGPLENPYTDEICFRK